MMATVFTFPILEGKILRALGEEDGPAEVGELREMFAGIPEMTPHDEKLNAALEIVLADVIQQEATQAALKEIIRKNTERLRRLEAKSEKIRRAIAEYLAEAELEKRVLPSMTVSVRKLEPKLVFVEGREIPDIYIIKKTTSEVDKFNIRIALQIASQKGEELDFAALVEQPPSLVISQR